MTGLGGEAGMGLGASLNLVVIEALSEETTSKQSLK